MCVVGLPVARYVYSFGTGKASSGCSSVGLERLSDKQEVFGSSNLPIPTQRLRPQASYDARKFRIRPNYYTKRCSWYGRENYGAMLSNNETW